METFERTSETGFSWIWGLVTMSNCLYLLGGGSATPAPPLTVRAHRERDEIRVETLDAPPLPGPAAVVGDRGDVLDPQDLQARGRERADGGLPAGARPLDEDVHPL